MEQPNLSISVPPIWVDFCPTSFFGSNETCSGNPEAYGHSPDNIPGRHLDLTPGKGGTNSAHSTDLSDARSSGTGGQPQEVIVNPATENGILGIYSRCNNTASDISDRKAQENSAASPAPPSSTNCLSEGSGKICGESLSINEGDMAGPTALQGTTVSDSLCDARGPLSNRVYGNKIQC